MNVHLLDVVKIWAAAPHCAFTGLTHYRDHFYCTFREGQGHMSLDGKLRVIRSTDGRKWECAALLCPPNSEYPDLRDPKIGVAPDGRLMLIGVGATRGEKLRYQSYLWLSDDGENWDDGKVIGEQDVWMWNFATEGEALYGIGHAEEGGTLEGEGVRLYRDTGDSKFEFLNTLRRDDEFPCETAVVFHDGLGVALVRHEWDEGGAPPRLGLGPSVVGVASAPYADWTWFEYQEPVGGPALIRLPDGRYLAGGRKKIPQDHTALWEVDIENGQLRELITLPSANDSSYPGFVWHDDLLYVSYYSGHEGQSSIYLARLEVS
jgi:hypothetical protein